MTLRHDASAEIQTKLVHVEFLRAGPPHNQLLSPLTDYLAVAGESGAGVISVPWEHAEFERRLKELRYETGAPTDRHAMLHATGREMGKLLGAVPGLPGALNSTPNHAGTLIHLRITLSASELALLPFELAKTPVSATASGENWLSIQTRPPVCITRNIRTVSTEGVVWPDRPRILFISSDPDDVPYEEHRRALLKAIEPFRYPGKDGAPVPAGTTKDFSREQHADLLTILVDPTRSDIVQECRANRYTHVHILAHGDLSEKSPGAFGLVLRSRDGLTEVVSGDEFASALTSVGDDRIHRPTVVTLATCDSGNVGVVTVPGASFAHALHQSGIPLVVASQFPLSKDGSVPLADGFYKGLLWGKNPLVLLQQLRAELHALYTADWHDWASLIVYEALPQSWEHQLDALRYAQARRAINAVLERIDRAVRKIGTDTATNSLDALNADIEAAVERLPLGGQYRVECIGLRASSLKRRAEAAFKLSENGSSETTRQWKDQYELLDAALHDYDQGIRGMLMNEARAAQQIATLHWVVVQFVSLSTVLGREKDQTRWNAGKLAAELYREHSDVEERAWAHGSLAELWLLRLGVANLSKENRAEFREKAIHHVRELSAFYPWNDEFPIKSTRRQFERYVNWWGSQKFEEGLEQRGWSRASWRSDDCILLQTAQEMVEILRRSSQESGTDTKDGQSPESVHEANKDVPEKPEVKNGNGAAAAARTPSKKLRRSRTSGAPFFSIEMLPAGHGDALWIEYGDGKRTHRWLMDCGTQQTAKALDRRVQSVPEDERFLELFIMSHIDSDHIGGALPFFKTIRKGLKFGDVWFNGARHLSAQLGARQGEMFSTAILDFQLPWNKCVDGDRIVTSDGNLPEIELPGGMKLTLLSPTPLQLEKLAPVWKRELKRLGLEPGGRVDYSNFLRATPTTSTDIDELADTPFTGDKGAPNGSSIAVLAEYGGASALLGADAHSPVLTGSIRKLLQRRKLEKLKINVLKVPHHGSQNNLSTELLELLDCQQYLISTNGSHFLHPDRQAIARIIKYGGNDPSLYFNYRSRFNEVWESEELREKHGYSTYYPQKEVPGMRFTVLGEPAIMR